MAIFPLYTLSIVLFLCLFHQSSHCQQAYISDSQYFNCSVYTSTSKGYLCNGLELCESFVTFKSQPPYDTAISIAHLQGSEASSIASFNNIYDTDKIPSKKLIIVPVSCSCAGNLYRHFVSYTIKPGDKYSNSIYQGLTTCQVMIGQYYYDPESLPVGTELMVPVRCACPTLNQTMRGVTSLVAYMVRMGDNVSLIADTFGVDAQSIFEANMLPEDRIIASTPLLVPLKGKTCTRKSDSNFFCNCPGGYLTDGGKCIPDGTKLPVKRVALLGVGIGMAIGFLCLFLHVTCCIATKRQEDTESERKSYSSKMVASCYKRDSHPMEVMKKQKYSLQRSCRKQQTTTTGADILVREAMARFIKECYQMVA